MAENHVKMYIFVVKSIQMRGMIPIPERRRFYAAEGNEKRDNQIPGFFGDEETQDDALKIVDSIVNASTYEENGVEPANRILFLGPLGAGKKTLAKSIAEKAGVKYLYLSTAELLMDDYSARIKKIFDAAAKAKPCILFVDEFDMIARDIPGKPSGEILRLREFIGQSGSLPKEVFLIVSSNGEYPMESIVDHMFPKTILLCFPDLQSRMDYLSELLKNKACVRMSEKEEDNEYDIHKLARLTLDSRKYCPDALTLSGIKAVIDEVLGDHLYQESWKTSEEEETEVKDSRIDISELTKRLEIRLMGESWKTNPDTAYHEAGHTVLQYLFGRRPQVVTIMARGDYYGYSSALRELKTRKSVEEQIMISMAGRAAEVIYYGEDPDDQAYNTGASDDLKKATEYACLYLPAQRSGTV